jgi:hypothetical protein
MTVLLTVLLKIYPEEPSIHAGYSRFINGTYPRFRFQTVSGTLKTRSPLGLTGFFIFALGSTSSAGQHLR